MTHKKISKLKSLILSLTLSLSGCTTSQLNQLLYLNKVVSERNNGISPYIHSDGRKSYYTEEESRAMKQDGLNYHLRTLEIIKKNQGN